MSQSKKIKNAICAAVKLNLTVVVNIESGKDRIFKVEELLKDSRIAVYAAAAATKTKVSGGTQLQISKNFDIYICCPQTQIKKLHLTM